MAKRLVIPWELKYKFLKGGYTSLFKGWLYAVREEYGAEAALRLYEKICKMSDRVKNLTNTLKDIFNIEGNDCETFAKWFDIWDEIMGREVTITERSKTIARKKIITCPFKTEAKDIGDHCLIMANIVAKTINPKTTLERPKGMCAGDQYCEFVTRIEE